MALAILRSVKELKRYHGRQAKIIGVLNVVPVRKGPGSVTVSRITIQDGTKIVVGYGPEAERHRDFDEQKVGVIGLVLMSGPDPSKQYLVAPHMVDPIIKKAGEDEN